MPIPTVLIIDDSDDFRQMASGLLLDAGFDVWDASCPHDAFSLLHRERFDLILCDLHMPFMNGPEGAEYETSCRVGINTIRELKGLFPDIPVIALTSTDPLDLDRMNCSLGDIKALAKPMRCKDLMTIVRSSIEHGAPGALN